MHVVLMQLLHTKAAVFQKTETTLKVTRCRNLPGIFSHQHPLQHPSVGNFEASSLGEKVMFILFPQALQHVSSNITASHVQLLHSIREKEAIVNRKRSSDRVTRIHDQT